MSSDYVYEVTLNDLTTKFFYSIASAYEYATTLIYEYEGDCHIYCENIATVQGILQKNPNAIVWFHENEPSNRVLIWKHFVSP